MNGMERINLSIDPSRHEELFSPLNFKTPITVIGCGATGSWIVNALARLAINDITVYDGDVVEAHNIPNQHFTFDDVGKNKAVAMADKVSKELRGTIKAKDSFYTNERLKGIVILQVDSMRERRRISDIINAQNLIHGTDGVKLLIDTRLGMDGGRVYTFDPSAYGKAARYEQTLYSDEGTEVSQCGHSISVITSAMVLSAWAVRQIINWHNNVIINNEVLIDFLYNNIITYDF
jgi:hypothetical protein